MSKLEFPGISEELSTQIEQFLCEQKFSFSQNTLRGFLFENKLLNKGIILDFDICNKDIPYHYNQYTKEQNLLMHNYNCLYRFILENSQDFEEFKTQFQIFEKKQFNEDGIKSSGVNRTLTEIDPTIPESYFERAFVDVYGNESLDCALREEPVLDYGAQTRYVDYLIKTKNGNIAIEKNGERYHHPIIIQKQRYKKQLFKQNSLMANGTKVYRWSIEGMKSFDNFHEEIKMFIGEKNQLISTHKLNVSRNVKLFHHQADKLDEIKKERATGSTNFLVVLPVGTGKTEIMIADMIEEHKRNNLTKALVTVPSRALRDDTIKKIQKRFYDEGYFHLKVSDTDDSDIMVVTYANICRNYHIYSYDNFKYFVVDEAHHAVAPMLQKVIQYFKPLTLLGLTATDKRLDEKHLSSIFGQYNETLTLKEALEKGLIAPIKAYRIKTNIDFTEIRYNGKDYFSTDIQKSIFVPSRDQLIVDELKKYFFKTNLGFKSGIIFCVSIRHAEEIAKKMKLAGFLCEAVSSQQQNSDEYIEKYQNGEIQFLATCSLLNEGWDSPRTSVIVMARPTLSKVLYTQQLGRGTRKMEGKEALYVIDVVDNYGAYGTVSNQPWSINAILGLDKYKPFASILNPMEDPSGNEELILEGLYESVRKLEPINIFTLESLYGDYLSDEQLARELFVSTSTIKNWIKNKKIFPSLTLPMGNTTMNYYAPNYKNEIIKALNLSIHDETTIYKDFFDFLEERDYSLSYKMIMILSFLKIMNSNGECNLDDLVNEYKVFYLDRIANNLIVDRKSCPFDESYLNDCQKLKGNILQNPFEKFERKRFIHYTKDLNYISFSTILWEKFDKKNDIEKIKMNMLKDLDDYYKKLNAPINLETWKNYWNVNFN